MPTDFKQHFREETMRYTRGVWAIPLCACLVLVLQGQDPVFKLSVNVPVVSLEAVVKDSSDRPLTHLSLADFDIYEDGEKQEIRYFEPADNPRSILLIFDVTGVMDEQKSFMAKAMDAFFANVREQDRVAVGFMGPEFEMTMNFRKIEKSKPVNVKLPQQRMGSNLYESLSMAARRFGKEDTRKAIIAMTDGRETNMFNDTKRLGNVLDIKDDSDIKKRLEDARKRGVPYYFIALDTEPRFLGKYDMEYAFFKNADGYLRTSEYQNGQRSPTIAEDYLAGVRLRMERLADATGGRVLYPQNLNQVVGFFERISRELGYSYSLGYVPKSAANDGKAHKIEVRTKAGYKVEQSRTGYVGAK
jgi:VWFA-related protein